MEVIEIDHNYDTRLRPRGEFANALHRRVMTLFLGKAFSQARELSAVNATGPDAPNVLFV